MFGYSVLDILSLTGLWTGKAFFLRIFIKDKNINASDARDAKDTGEG